MPLYVDGFVLPIPKDKIDQYRLIAEQACKIWMEHGALEYRECIGDDMEAKDMVAFPQLAGTTPEEIVVFSWITYKSREHRDEVNAKVMADPRIHSMGDKDSMPFDCKRIAYGGFRAIVES
jgi:uncharacterized protein YbaA (DUF1428 family)